MRYVQARLLLWGLLSLAGGTLLPPAAFAERSLLFASEADGTRLLVLGMDEEANLSFREQWAVGQGSYNLVVSPDKRMVIASSNSDPMLSLFRIQDDGSLTTPTRQSNPRPSDYYVYYNALCFHPTLPLFYVGFEPISCFQYSADPSWAEPTGSTVVLPNYGFPSYTLGYSAWADAVVLLKPTTTDHQDYVQSIKINPDGSFGQINTPLRLPAPAVSGDFAVSPDGRWAAASGRYSPQLQFIRIEQDGALSLAQALEFTVNEVRNGSLVAFTPDSRRLIMNNWGNPLMISFELDAQAGTLINRRNLEGFPDGWYLSSMGALAISPDGRWAVFSAQSDAQPRYDMIQPVRIHEDGRLEYRPDKVVLVDRHIAALAFAPLPRRNAVTSWAWYE